MRKYRDLVGGDDKGIKESVMNILEWWTSVLAGDERRFVMKIIKNYPESVKPPKGLGRVISKHLEIKTRFLIVEQRATKPSRIRCCSDCGSRFKPDKGSVNREM